MASALTPAALPAHELYERLLRFDDATLASAQRARLLDRFFSSSSGREKPGRFWRVDFESIAPVASAIDAAAALSSWESGDARVLVCDLETAAREHPQLLARAFGKTGISATKFGALATAFFGRGIFIYVRADHACDEPIEVRHQAAPGAAVFPWTVVLAERGSRATIVERLTAGEGAFVCGAAEVVSEAHAGVTYAVVQQADPSARIISSRAARPGRDAEMSWAVAELGGELAAGDLSVAIEEPGVSARVTALFFPRGSQHVDLVSTVEHRAGEASSETLIKSAARERGQARFLGNIRIAPHAQGSDARLRDDALLLSTTAHVDSVPALEIGANDVKAYHGATVGAIDAEQIFYMESRGIERAEAERMIALGFFEPAIEPFPSMALREEIRAALAAKLT
ncbi:MAG: Fe-S cluster assembly protein SufD [Candidatus Eremiobacteraeota bacterium]|nr:Fe-S cluster assembly protein SufD [Candidatus Eremiobacteraeota bacterium]